MAEGGDNTGDNPFSFKKFVTPKDFDRNQADENNHTVSNGQVLDILPDIGDSSNKTRRKERQTLVFSEKTPINSKTKKKKNGDENPFSFKKFLSGSSSSSGTHPRNTQNSLDSGAKVSPRVAPNFASDLPDFVQDHFSEHAHDFNLPDFAVSSQRSNSLTTNNDGTSNDNLFSTENDNCVESEPVVMTTGGTTSLPDFLADGILKNDCDHIDNRISICEENGEYELELRLLREENSMLRTQLEEAKKEAVTESQRCHKMKKDMEDLQEKETEENAALENMIQQIDANLTTTTKRAVQAETTVSKLQTEVKNLQKQVTSLRGENDLLRSGDQGLAEIRERTKYCSEQLTNASITAEQSLKQLLQGVDQMKLFAQVLSSIDRISEETSEEDSIHKQNSNT